MSPRNAQNKKVQFKTESNISSVVLNQVQKDTSSNSNSDSSSSASSSHSSQITDTQEQESQAYKTVTTLNDTLKSVTTANSNDSADTQQRIIHFSKEEKEQIKKISKQNLSQTEFKKQVNQIIKKQNVVYKKEKAQEKPYRNTLKEIRRTLDAEQLKEFDGLTEKQKREEVMKIVKLRNEMMGKSDFVQ